LNCFFLLVDEPEVYGLPSKPELPSENVTEGFALSATAAAAIALTGIVSFRKSRMDDIAASQSSPEAPA
jgi:formate dehydrogenase iron-sulfur subunit